MNPKTIKRGGIAVFMIGLALLVFPMITGWQTNNEQAALEKEWNALNTPYDNPLKLPAVKAAKSTNTEKDNDPKASETAKGQALKKGVIGKMSIPKIDLQSMMVPGVSQKDLQNAIGWMTSTSFPGEKGNSVVAGHRSHSYGQFFHRLDEVEKGDTIKVETTSGPILYRIYEKVVVTPDNLSVLEAKKEEEITLITCEPLYSDEFRLIVRAERIN
ncbi:class D sortase [Fictibacillus nanhaiensis]|uniref:sortase n=1 Tax=Fictibacillus nanhaiensis TaxID=742169 RepID=UPI001C9855BB|nr:class D sortase [Fictibacillus nanhaiensis]MBY6037438.1 class D sortase [Fictibacillus nanhaiensis]